VGHQSKVLVLIFGGWVLKAVGEQKPPIIRR